METVQYVIIKQGMVVICYEDDLLVFSHQEREIEVFKSTLLQKFVVKYLRHPKQFLDIELLWKYHGMIQLRQSALIEKLLSTYGMERAKEKHNPMNPSDKVPVSTAELNYEQADSHRSKVGSLLYIVIKTRSDINTAASVLGTSLSRPEAKHLKAVHRVLKYLRARTH